MSWRNTHHYSSDVTISANVDEALDKISFVKIKEAYEDRLEEKENNPEYFRNSEKFRDDDTIDFDIDVGDYDLMYINDESLDDFDLEQIINTVEDSGYTVVNNKYCWNDYSIVIKYLNDLPKWKLREVLCDLTGLNHLVSNDEIIREIKEKIN